MVCIKCQPDLFPSGDAHNEGHMGVRFEGCPCYRYRVFLDEEDVSYLCPEAIPGNPGLVVLHVMGSDHGYCLDCGRGYESFTVSGDVRVVEVPVLLYRKDHL